MALCGRGFWHSLFGCSYEILVALSGCGVGSGGVGWSCSNDVVGVVGLVKSLNRSFCVAGAVRVGPLCPLLSTGLSVRSIHAGSAERVNTSKIPRLVVDYVPNSGWGYSEDFTQLFLRVLPGFKHFSNGLCLNSSQSCASGISGLFGSGRPPTVFRFITTVVVPPVYSQIVSVTVCRGPFLEG